MKERNKERLAGFLFIVLVLGFIVSYPVAYVGSTSTATITVSDKERITESTGDSVYSKYVIYTEEGEVFENTDTVLFSKFNSSDVYGKLRKGKRYRVHLAGWRVRVLSSYRNIISATLIEDPKPASKD